MGRFGLPDDRPQGLDSALTSKLIKYLAKAQVRAFKLTNGRVGSKWRVGAGFRKPVPTLLLNHVGRKSGTTFTTPLLYLEDEPNLVVVASQGGLPRNPQWFPNLVAAPETSVRIRKTATARACSYRTVGRFQALDSCLLFGSGMLALFGSGMLAQPQKPGTP